MKKIKQVGLLLITFIVTACSDNAPNNNENAINTFNIESHLQDIFDIGIRPQVQLLQNEIANFDTLLANFNEVSNEENFNELRESWKTLILSWKPLEVITIGDFALTSKIVAIHFWPIQEETLKTNIENFTVNEFNLNARARGLGALEYILFSNDYNAFINNDLTENSIAYLNVITDQLIIDIDSYDQEWLDYESDFKTGVQSSVTGTQNKLINEIIFTFFDIIVTKIQGVELSNNDNAFLLNSEAPYSELSLEIIEAQIEFIQKIFSGTFTEGENTVSIYDQLNSLERADLIEALEAQFGLVLTNLSSQENSLEYLIKNNIDALTTLENNITALNVLISTDVVSVLDILVTVSDNDGD